MKQIKFINKNTIRIGEETSTNKIKYTKLKGYTIGELPNEMTSWFTYKGLTFLY
tara:strand:- start:22 stop:183 length:162 start_codon:yes stop_codon:yes gene_type:complete